jgi:hypothetical protein
MLWIVSKLYDVVLAVITEHQVGLGAAAHLLHVL